MATREEILAFLNTDEGRAQLEIERRQHERERSRGRRGAQGAPERKLAVEKDRKPARPRIERAVVAKPPREQGPAQPRVQRPVVAKPHRAQRPHRDREEERRQRRFESFDAFLRQQRERIRERLETPYLATKYRDTQEGLSRYGEGRSAFDAFNVTVRDGQGTRTIFAAEHTNTVPTDEQRQHEADVHTLQWGTRSQKERVRQRHHGDSPTS